MRPTLERHAARMRARSSRPPADATARGIRRAKIWRSVGGSRSAMPKAVEPLTPELAALYAVEPCFVCGLRAACAHRNLREDLATLAALAGAQ